MRTFELVRLKDTSGVSGIGTVAEGVQFRSGKVALCWCTKMTDIPSIGVYDQVVDVEAIHGHDGDTVIVWHDEEEYDG